MLSRSLVLFLQDVLYGDKDLPEGMVLLKDAAMGFVSIQTVFFVLWADLYRAWT